MADPRLADWLGQVAGKHNLCSAPEENGSGKGGRLSPAQRKAILDDLVVMDRRLDALLAEAGRG